MTTMRPPVRSWLGDPVRPIAWVIPWWSVWLESIWIDVSWITRLLRTVLRDADGSREAAQAVVSEVPEWGAGVRDDRLAVA